MKNLILLIPLLVAGCPTLSNLTRLDEMDEPAYERYVGRLSTDVGAIAATAVAEGDLDAESTASIASALRVVAGEGAAAAGGSLGAALGLDGYGALALTLAINRLEEAFEARGAYGEGGVLSERARGVLSALADAIEASGVPSPAP